MSSLLEKIASFLRESPGKDFGLAEITEAILERYTDEYAHKKPTSIRGEIASHLYRAEKVGKYPQIKKIKGISPIRRYWDDGYSYPVKISADGVVEATSPPTRKPSAKQPAKRKNRQGERELYDKLRDYLEVVHGLYAVRIEEGSGKGRGSVRGANKHRFPDVVAVQGVVSSKELNPWVKQMADNFNIERARLWSFEVKEKLERGTVRASFHQTVANSVWANYAYLCANHIDDNAEEELFILTKAYGVGVIKIDKDEPLKSEIYIQAKQKEIDLLLCNSLADNNKQFEDFIRQASEIYQIGSVERYRGQR